MTDDTEYWAVAAEQTGVWNNTIQCLRKEAMSSFFDMWCAPEDIDTKAKRDAVWRKAKREYGLRIVRVRVEIVT